jgi:hypothetical protein
MSGNGFGRSIIADADGKVLNRGRTLKKSGQAVRRIINANVEAYGEKAKFVTLTFAKNVKENRVANAIFGKFVKRLNYEIFRDKKARLKYLTVIEFQKRGAIHYHVVFFNLPYMPKSKLSEIWGQGFVKINNIDNVDNVGAYVSKYMTKDTDDDRLIGEKSYFCSRGLIKPEEIIDKEKIERVLSSLPSEKTYVAEFENEYCGKILYCQYNIKKSAKTNEAQVKHKL